MKGVFRLYQDGVLVAEKENVVTTAGKKLIQRYLAGQSASLGEAIALGVSGSPSAAVGDVRLNFEIARVPVALKNADFSGGVIVFKGTLPQEDVYTVYEMGLWSQYSDALAAGFASSVLTKFNTAVEAWSNVTADTTNTRASGQAAKVTVGSGATVSVRNSDVSLDLSGYSGNDLFSVAFYKPDNNIASVTFVFEDQTTGGNFKSAAQTISGLPVGYNVVQVAKSTMVQTGTISWASINKFGMDVTATATGSFISLDSIRVEDTDTINQDYALVSHTTNATALATKTSVAPMDVEYAVNVTVA